MAKATQPIMIDGVPLKEQLARAERRKKYIALGMVLPLLLFIVVTFAIPILSMLFRSVDNPRMITIAPNLAAAVQQWDGIELPSEEVFEIAFHDLVAAKEAGHLGKIATHLNYSLTGGRSLILKTKRKFKKIKSGPYREAMIKSDKRWGNIHTWAVIKKVSPPYTARYFLNAMDLDYDDLGKVVAKPEEKQIYVTLFIRTLWISLLVTLLTLIIGYPIAYLISTTPPKISNLLIIMVLLPFWTSLLVRIVAWMVMLQQEGVINDTLVNLHVLSDENRLPMMFNGMGAVIGMILFLLPFMILPIYSVMKTIPPSYMRAAQNLGASPSLAFLRVYMPQTLPGIGAGVILVFIVAIGYYITPDLVGGKDGKLIGNMIAYHMQKSLNWGLAAAMGTLLLAAILVLYWVYDKIVGIDNLKMG